MKQVSPPPPLLQFQSNPEPDLEVVVCSGYGKNGALSVLQVNLYPLYTILKTFSVSPRL